MGEQNYNVIFEGIVPIKAWVKGLPLDDGARNQLIDLSRMPFIHKWVAAMPDVHLGIGATVGSVIPTLEAIIPAAVGVDIGCGMMACRTTLTATDLPDNLREMRKAIEKAVPHGRTSGGRRNDKGAWQRIPKQVEKRWAELDTGFRALLEKYPKLERANHIVHLGTLGTGNHFVEVCLDESQQVWFMLHSGSRGIGNRIGMFFIEMAKRDMERWHLRLPDKNLAYFPEGTEHFDDYVMAVNWAQQFARINRELMMAAVIDAVRRMGGLPQFKADVEAVNCHHNYVKQEFHYGKDVWVTRKGAVRAGKGELGIIPGSMGASSYIVRGKGNPESFESCSHGAGRSMSRSEARRRFTVEDHRKATADVECRKDDGVIDETPMAYKPIDQVMAAQTDLVEIVYRLRQVVCVKG